jgi:hypothetical protein
MTSPERKNSCADNRLTIESLTSSKTGFIWVADLYVKGCLLFGQALGVHEIEEKIVGFFRTEQVNVSAQKRVIHKKLDGRRAKDREVEFRDWRQGTGEFVKPFSGGRLPRDMVCLKIKA